MLSTGLVRRAATTTSRLLQQHNFHTSVTIRAEDDKWQRNALGNSSQKYNENFNRIFQVDNMNRPLKSEEGAQKEQVTLPAMTTEEAEARAALAAAKAGRVVLNPLSQQVVTTASETFAAMQIQSFVRLKCFLRSDEYHRSRIKKGRRANKSRYSGMVIYSEMRNSA